MRWRGSRGARRGRARAPAGASNRRRESRRRVGLDELLHPSHRLRAALAPGATEERGEVGAATATAPWSVDLVASAARSQGRPLRPGPESSAADAPESLWWIATSAISSARSSSLPLDLPPASWRRTRSPAAAASSTVSIAAPRRIVSELVRRLRDARGRSPSASAAADRPAAPRNAARLVAAAGEADASAASAPRVSNRGDWRTHTGSERSRHRSAAGAVEGLRDPPMLRRARGGRGRRGRRGTCTARARSNEVVRRAVTLARRDGVAVALELDRGATLHRVASPSPGRSSSDRVCELRAFLCRAIGRRRGKIVRRPRSRERRVLGQPSPHGAPALARLRSRRRKTWRSARNPIRPLPIRTRRAGVRVARAHTPRVSGFAPVRWSS